MSTTDIAQLDKNFLGEEITYDGMTFHHVLDEPFKVYGLYNVYEEKKFKRMPDELAMQLNKQVQSLYKHTSGGRIRFRTNSTKILLRSILPKITKHDHMPKTGSSCFDLYVDGEYKNSFRHGFLSGVEASKEDRPENVYDSNITIGEKQMHDILINFPLYNRVDDVFIALDDDAIIEPPKDYTIQKPFVIYGSSITQGGCASHPGNAYANILSRRFDADIINLGFSSGAKGEQAMAEYIGSLDMSLFIYDYDHNASVSHLAETHEPFFKTFRKLNPDVPVIMASAADGWFGKMQERKATIRTTYENAIAAGDKNVYYIDGDTIYAPVGRGACTVDHIHPNDIGFLMMANAFEAVIKEILKK